MKLMHLALGLFLATAAAAGWAQAASAPAGFTDAARGPVPIMKSTEPPRLGNAVNNDRRLTRNYDLQPPIIPHRVDGYQIDRNFNKCLDCHARDKTAVSLAVPVSATHYIDRSGKVLDRISTRRYFCQQCHVAQEDVTPLVGNRFQGLGTDARPQTK
ncbi:MAG TPA: nitrate reductase cytochrome c-type subunit [Rhizobacter sp.]|nr:nitrate reductase cytochrome c-type subunit [Rhizobacter sp.]